MKRMIIKVCLNLLAHCSISLTILGIAYSDHSPVSNLTASLIKCIIIALYQIPIYLIYRICPLSSEYQKKLYWKISILFTAINAIYWVICYADPVSWFI